MKSLKELERIVKGFANHQRLEIAFLLKKNPGLSLLDIAGTLRVNFKTISEHTRRLELAGIVRKRYKGSFVRHELSPLGKNILKFLRILE
jgi:predicted ArsR family transcriptional regulator